MFATLIGVGLLQNVHLRPVVPKLHPASHLRYLHRVQYFSANRPPRNPEICSTFGVRHLRALAFRRGFALCGARAKEICKHAKTCSGWYEKFSRNNSAALASADQPKTSV
jgi:hypothetical protein